ncbi:protein MpUGT17 [Marchantia polymorpha subsp. ruderalis]|uniref:Glycosyltransferase n=2 Tax=Marchantia polymorpha TaxID=3197 RepID=A0A176WEN8_MARPO|nr:hypothetical protein AXG93_3415s1090 [Marchantia polymorpha subsp. ruderalis]PTQ30413.1 hypothetical protein MARPO_0125s0042 [Marchantia polymorpha]BBN07879.1 hypothetical protein Mp_4g06970 [Marchantia polymorpha subsp. ruderalis]|eukprot:PTQ30413.1 hypothetical protein MARPO_0125s0042 [Marchantia polymorpha]
MDYSGEHNSVSNGTKEVKPAPNVWIIPLPWFSHILCHLNLAKKLAKHGLTVTFCLPEEEIQHLAAAGHITPESCQREGFDIRLQPLVAPRLDLGSGENTRGGLGILKQAVDTQDAFEEALKNKWGSDSAPTCVISDIWLPRTRDVVKEYNLPAWVLSTLSLTFTAGYFYVHNMRMKGNLKLARSKDDPEFQHEQICVPGLDVIPYKDLPGGWFTESPIFDHSRISALSLAKADVILVSSFQELEERSFCALERQLKTSPKNPHRKVSNIWTVGPTFQFPSIADEAGEEERHSCLKFLDSQSKSSVLYVAFGSDGCHSREQILEIAHGLESSGQPFLCVLHRPMKTPDCQTDDIFAVIPSECIERTKDRGLFVQSWAPQQKVLSHPSTGGFLSHFGFNSMLEAVCFGVPLIAWPLGAEQRFNTRWAVDEAKIGLEVYRGPDGFVERGEVERSVKALFYGDEARVLRKNVSDLHQKAKECVGENGSTTKNLQAIVDHIQGTTRSNLKLHI